MGDNTYSRGMVSADAAWRMVDAGRAKAAELGAAVTIVVVDAAGQIVVQFRMDGAGALSPIAAEGKAWTSASLGMSTAQWFEYTTAEKAMTIPLTGEPRLTSFPGGLPITSDGAVVGGVGTAGGAPDQDVAVSEAALAAITA